MSCLVSVTGILSTASARPDMSPRDMTSFPVAEASPAQACQCIVAVDPLDLHSEGFPAYWPPCVGQKLIAHIKVRNTCAHSVHLQHMGVRGRRNGTEFWDIGFWEITIPAGVTWELNPNNERLLEPGWYCFRISYSPDGTGWCEIGNDICFTAAPSCAGTSTPSVTATTRPAPSATLTVVHARLWLPLLRR